MSRMQTTQRPFTIGYFDLTYNEAITVLRQKISKLEEMIA